MKQRCWCCIRRQVIGTLCSGINVLNKLIEGEDTYAVFINELYQKLECYIDKCSSIKEISIIKTEGSAINGVVCTQSGYTNCRHNQLCTC